MNLDRLIAGILLRIFIALYKKNGISFLYFGHKHAYIDVMNIQKTKSACFCQKIFAFLIYSILLASNHSYMQCSSMYVLYMIHTINHT
jgi:hypothetical protein